jgi:hypothetical protein
MDQLVPVLMIVGIVAFVMVRQIGKITNNTDEQPSVNHVVYERYAKYSSIIQEHVREIKNALDSSKALQESPFKLLAGKSELEALERLSDYIRKLVFFETMMAKQKSEKEIEAELFELLSGLETFLKEYCDDGENLAEQLRANLLEAYESL